MHYVTNSGLGRAEVNLELKSKVNPMM